MATARFRASGAIKVCCLARSDNAYANGRSCVPVADTLRRFPDLDGNGPVGPPRKWL